MNEEAREAINKSIAIIADVLNVNTRRGIKTADYTVEDIVNYARAMAILARCLACDKSEAAELENQT